MRMTENGDPPGEKGMLLKETRTSGVEAANQHVAESLYV